MKKSIVVMGILITAGAGAVYVFSIPDSTDAPQTSIISGLHALSTERTGDLPPAAKKTDDDLPVPKEIGPWPRVVIDESSYAFGRMQVKQENSHPFVIRNEGDADLLLKAGKTTCKCTQFDFDPSEKANVQKAVVRPGESITLTMSWKAGDGPDRNFRHGGDVFTNDPKQTTLRFTVEGAIDMPYELRPQSWNVGDVFDGQPGKFKGEIASRIYDNMEIESIQCPSEFVKVTAAPMTPAEKGTDHFSSGFVLDVEVSSGIPSGIFREELEVRLLQQKEPIKVPIIARKHGAIRLQQMAGTAFNANKLQLSLGSFAASEGREAKLLMIVDEKGMTEPLEITTTKADPSFITASLTSLGEPTGTVHRYVLTLTVPPNRPHTQRVEAKPGFIEVSTNHISGEGMKFDVLMYSN